MERHYGDPVDAGTQWRGVVGWGGPSIPGDLSGQRPSGGGPSGEVLWGDPTERTLWAGGPTPPEEVALWRGRAAPAAGDGRDITGQTPPPPPPNTHLSRSTTPSIQAPNRTTLLRSMAVWSQGGRGPRVTAGWSGIPPAPHSLALWWGPFSTGLVWALACSDPERGTSLPCPCPVRAIPRHHASPRRIQTKEVVRMARMVPMGMDF